jgi:lia operon protein LiaF
MITEENMPIRFELLVGSILLILGVIWLGGNILGVDIWALCWPAGLILLGAWLLVRPRLTKDGGRVQFLLFGDVRRSGDWSFTNEEIWMGIGDVDLDLTRAYIPPGESILRVFSFISDIDLLVPEGTGVSLTSYAFVTDSKIFDRKKDSFILPLELESEGYSTAGQKVRVEVFGFINDIKAKKVRLDV